MEQVFVFMPFFSSDNRSINSLTNDVARVFLMLFVALLAEISMKKTDTFRITANQPTKNKRFVHIIQ